MAKHPDKNRRSRYGFADLAIGTEKSYRADTRLKAKRIGQAAHQFGRPYGRRFVWRTLPKGSFYRVIVCRVE